MDTPFSPALHKNRSCNSFRSIWNLKRAQFLDSTTLMTSTPNPFNAVKHTFRAALPHCSPVAGPSSSSKRIQELRYDTSNEADVGMRDSGDFIIASVPLDDEEEGNKSKESPTEEEESEINLTGLVDHAEVYENSVAYDDLGALERLAFPPLKDCPDLLTLNLLEDLSTRAR
jgi:hypothetical protein